MQPGMRRVAACLASAESRRKRVSRPLPSGDHACTLGSLGRWVRLWVRVRVRVRGRGRVRFRGRGRDRVRVG